MTLFNTGMNGENTEQKNAEDKSKTPMWQVNQLARYHKLKPDYKLLKEENGKIKKFTMSLTLDTDVWTGCANTKKQAKQNAAKNALKNTKLTLPPPTKKKSCSNAKALTETVKLNGWAMAHGKGVAYKVMNKKYPPRQQHFYQDYAIDLLYECPGFIHGEPNEMSFSRRPFRQRPYFYAVCVQVGEESFAGNGPTEQAARHDAAKNALRHLENPKQDIELSQGCAGENSGEKSIVCTLHEQAMQRNMTIVFNILDEKGPAHLRFYTVEVVAGTFIGESLDENQQHFRAVGTGKSKKAAKHAAAFQILSKLRGLPVQIKKTPKVFKGTGKKLPPSTEALHPVSRLMQICQAQKMKEPIYDIIDEVVQKRGDSRFSVQCSVQDKSVTGTGKSKKDAKKAAANAMLIELGKQPRAVLAVPNSNMVPTKSSLKCNLSADKSQNKSLQVKFVLSKPN